MIYLFSVIQFLKNFNFELIRETFEFLVLSALYTTNLEFLKTFVFGLEYVVIENERFLLPLVGFGGLCAFWFSRI